MNRARPLRRTVLAARAVAVLFCVAVAATGFSAPAATAAPAPGPDLSLRLVSQQLDVVNTGVFSVVVGVPDGIDAAAIAGSTMVVTAYNRVATREAVLAAIDGNLPRSVDSVDLPTATLSQISPGQLQIVVPIETSERTPPALQFARPGLYPVVIEMSSNGQVLADLLTFVHRLPDSTEPKEVELPVAVAMATTSPVTFDNLTNVTIDDATISELEHLADLLESSDMPVAVRIPPALLVAVRDSSPEGEALIQRLATAMGSNELISEPALPLDPSAAAAAGQQAVYTQWLRDGEDVLTAVVAQPSIRTVAFVDRPLSTGGGALQRELGARLLVIPAETYGTLINSPGAFADTSLVVRIAVGNDVTMHASVLDPAIAQMLGQPNTDPELTAVYTAVMLLATRQQVVDAGGNPARHGVTIGTADLSLPDTESFAAIAALLAVTEGLDTVSIDSIGVGTNELLDNDQPVVVALPDTVEASMTARVPLIESLQREVDSTASMLQPDDARSADWNQVIGTLPSSAITDDQATALATSLRTEFAVIREAVQIPSGFKFTLTGRSSTVPVKLLNNSSVPLTVQVRMSSAKLRVPAPQIVTLPPGEYTEVKLTIEARSNGTFPATLEIYTADGRLRLGPSVPLTANVRALSGLGNLVTGALLLVLLTWWVRHVRQNHRAKAAKKAAQRHPVGGNNNSADATERDDTGPSGLSPDAEASTLPPS